MVLWGCYGLSTLSASLLWPPCPYLHVGSTHRVGRARNVVLARLSNSHRFCKLRRSTCISDASSGKDLGTWQSPEARHDGEQSQRYPGPDFDRGRRLAATHGSGAVRISFGGVT